ncbi:hypothetical protein C8J56DRAFT_802909 [Mycena floridula]|nr:hypothetical protein C8J56DRAFT_802909 [Mycena floridula]
MHEATSAADNKTRRSARACQACRSRKQRCLYGESLSAPCERCRAAGKPCSFETENTMVNGISSPRHHPYASGSSQRMVEQLQVELADHRYRLDALEATILHGTPSRSRSDIGRQVAESSLLHSPSTSLDLPKAPKRHFSMDHISLEAPIATLRTLGRSIPGDESESSPLPRSPSYDGHSQGRRSSDPITSGLVALEDAQRLLDIPVLLTAICSIGARYWPNELHKSSSRTLHPRYHELISLLDQCIMSLLLRPSSSDMNLEAVQAILLYVQWMPLEPNPKGGRNSQPRSRFNDISAWSTIGVAIRLATFIGLDRIIEAPFNSPTDITEEDVRRMRVWMNLLSVDHHLAMTARLPASLDPAPAARIARAFGSHPRAERSDLKVAGLCELVGIVHRAGKFCGDASLSRLDPMSLQKANAEFAEWESVWAVVMRNSGFDEDFHTQMPFTALRWYRLALNVVSLGPRFFSRNPEDIHAAAAVTLKTGIDAAAAMLYCFSADPVHISHGSAPPPRLTISNAVSKSFRYSIDAYWITHAFAVVFLALAYDRGVIDEDLNIVSLHSQLPSHAVPAPQERSILYRLVRLAVDIFDCAATCAPAAHHRDVVRNTFCALTEDRAQHGYGATSELTNIFAAVMEEGQCQYLRSMPHS